MKLRLVLLAINLVILLQSSIIETSKVEPNCLKIGTERVEAGECLCTVKYYYQYSNLKKLKILFDKVRTHWFTVSNMSVGIYIS